MAQAAKLKNEDAAGGAGGALPAAGLFSKVAEYPRRARQFLHEVRNQMRLVTWPTWNDVYSTTIVVVITVAFFALFFAVADNGLGFLSQLLLKQFKP
jgi:preprotein translocase subunit SecE